MDFIYKELADAESDLHALSMLHSNEGRYLYLTHTADGMQIFVNVRPDDMKFVEAIAINGKIFIQK